MFTHLSDATISAALIWTICDFHGSIHRSGFSYKITIHVQELLIHVCTQVCSQPEIKYVLCLYMCCVCTCVVFVHVLCLYMEWDILSIATNGQTDGLALNPGAKMMQSGGRFVSNGFQCGFSFSPKLRSSARLYPDPTCSEDGPSNMNAVATVG